MAVYFRVETKSLEPVPGMSSDQFTIYEDGQLVSSYESKQTILNPEAAAAHYTLLLVDMSGSVAESDDAALVGEAAQEFTSRVGAHNVVGVYAFDGAENIHKIRDFGPVNDGDVSVQEALSTYKPEDPSTNLHGAVVQGIDLLDKALAKSTKPMKFGTLVVFTDGTDRANRVSWGEMTSKIYSIDQDN